jgi:hypothetical protein
MNTTYTLHINILPEDGDVKTETHNNIPQLLDLINQYGCNNLGDDTEIELENTDNTGLLLSHLDINIPVENYYVVARPTLRIVSGSDIIIPTHICASYDKDSNSFQPCETFCSWEEMADECSGYSASDRTPVEHNNLETQRPLGERCIFVALEDLELESNKQLMCRSTLTQDYDQKDGGCRTFIPNWFNREHFEHFIGRKFENNEEYEDFLEGLQSEYGNHIAGIISTLMSELSQQYVGEEE